MRVAVIDADTIGWTAAYLAHRDNLSNEAMLGDLDTFIESIFFNTRAEQYVGFIQGPDSFRKRMFPTYKATRPPVPDWFIERKPVILDRVVNHWKFEYTKDGFEADDAVASIALIEHEKGNTPIVCAIDKDLQQVPGEHFNYKSAKTTSVQESEAWRCVCMQLLHGDATDNIPNLKRGIGPAKADKILNFLITRNIDEQVLNEFIVEYGFYEGLTKFAENVLKVVLRRDRKYQYTLNDVPIKQIEQNLFK